MRTEIESRKTAHSKALNIFGKLSIDTIWAERFIDNDINGPTEMTHIPKSQCYVKSGNQERLDNSFSTKEIRPTHVDVWNQRSVNRKRGLGWNTNYEVKNAAPDFSFKPNLTKSPKTSVETLEDFLS